MKHIGKFLIIVVAGLSLFACSKVPVIPQEDENPAAKTYSYTIAIEDDTAGDTKAHLEGNHMAWDEDDALYGSIRWFSKALTFSMPAFDYYEYSDISGTSSINFNTTPRTFTINTPYPIEPGEKIYACYTPYGNDGTQNRAFLSIKTTQTGVLKNAMPMVALPIQMPDEISANTPTVGSTQFINLGAVIKYNVYTSGDYASEQVVGVSFSSDSYIAGDFPVDLTTVSENTIPSISSQVMSRSVYSKLDTPVTVGSSKNNGKKIYQVIAPGTWSGKITVTTDVATYVYNVTDIEFQRSMFKTINVDLASANATRTLRDNVNLNLARSWQLTSVTKNNADVTYSAGDIITFNPDGHFSLDCSVHDNMIYDYNYNKWSDQEFRYAGTGTDARMQQWEWSIVNNTLHISNTCYPLVIVSNVRWTETENDYSIATLNSSSLVLENNGYRITFTVPGTNENAQALLTAKEWQLTKMEIVKWSIQDDDHTWLDWGFYRAQYGSSSQTTGNPIGNKISFNASHTLSFDCTANSGESYKVTPFVENQDGTAFQPENVGQMSWSVGNNGRALSFPAGSYPLVDIDVPSRPLSYGIEKLDGNNLVLLCYYDADFYNEYGTNYPTRHCCRLTFTAVQ